MLPEVAGTVTLDTFVSRVTGSIRESEEGIYGCLTSDKYYGTDWMLFTSVQSTLSDHTVSVLTSLAKVLCCVGSGKMLNSPQLQGAQSDLWPPSEERKKQSMHHHIISRYYLKEFRALKHAFNWIPVFHNRSAHRQFHSQVFTQTHTHTIGTHSAVGCVCVCVGWQSVMEEHLKQ